MPFRSGLDLVAEIDRSLPGAQVRVPLSVLGEIDRLVARRVAHAPAARLLAASFPVTPTDGRGDTAVLKAAVRRGAWVVTADRLFAARLRRHGVSTAVPRDRGRLHLERGEPIPAPPRAAAPARRGKG